MSFFSLKREPKLSLICDLRDTTVTVAAVQFETGRKPKFIVVETQSIPPRQEHYQAYTEALIKTIDAALVSVRKNLIKTGNHQDIDQHVFFLGSPWIVSQSKLIKIVREKMFEIDNTFLTRILSREESFASKHMDRHGEWQHVSILEEKVVATKLNGYPVEQVFKKKTRDFEAELLVSFIPTDLKERLEQFVHERLRRTNTLHGSLLVLHTFLHESMPEQSDMIIIDVGDVLTDICVMHDGVVSSTISFPLGRRHLIAQTILATKLSEAVVMSHLSMGHEGKIENNAMIENAFSTAVSSWTSLFTTSISQAVTAMNLPRNIVLIKNDSFIEILAGWLQKKQPIKLFGIDMQVTTLNDTVMNADIENAKIFPDQLYIKMDALFLARILNRK